MALVSWLLKRPQLTVTTHTNTEPQLASVGLCAYLAALVKCWEQFSIYTKPVIMLMQQLHYSDRYRPMAKQVFMKLFLQSDRLPRVRR